MIKEIDVHNNDINWRLSEIKHFSDVRHHDVIKLRPFGTNLSYNAVTSQKMHYIARAERREDVL